MQDLGLAQIEITPKAIPAPWRWAADTALPFSLGYFKGKTRVAVLMSMLSLARDLKIDDYAMVVASFGKRWNCI